MANGKNWWDQLAELIRSVLKEIFGGKEDKK
jgi:hypothetical protein